MSEESEFWNDEPKYVDVDKDIFNEERADWYTNEVIQNGLPYEPMEARLISLNLEGTAVGWRPEVFRQVGYVADMYADITNPTDPSLIMTMAELQFYSMLVFGEDFNLAVNLTKMNCSVDSDAFLNEESASHQRAAIAKLQAVNLAGHSENQSENESDMRLLAIESLAKYLKIKAVRSQMLLRAAGYGRHGFLVDSGKMPDWYNESIQINVPPYYPLALSEDDGARTYPLIDVRRAFNKKETPTQFADKIGMQYDDSYKMIANAALTETEAAMYSDCYLHKSEYEIAKAVGISMFETHIIGEKIKALALNSRRFLTQHQGTGMENADKCFCVVLTPEGTAEDRKDQVL